MMDGVKKIPIRSYKEEDGQLCCVEYLQELPFVVKRIFTISNVPDGKIRANHAVKNTNFFYML